MKEPPIPPDEASRMRTLKGMSILDSPPEERFDRYTRLARRLFDVPIALVSLVDSDRQWFKSRDGLDATETPRDISFCGHAILQDAVFVVEDASRDVRFNDNPLVTGAPDIRFYAGFPLAAPSGEKMGTLCIIDRKPRTLTQDDLAALEDIGTMVQNELASLEMATTDPLTGLSNRRGFDVLARQPMQRSTRTGASNSVVLIDMDGFKWINDTLGHHVGDEALCAFSTILLSTFRASDVAARIGGDEFCVFLAGAPADEASLAVERLEHAVEEWNQSSKRPYKLAFSAGVAECAAGSCIDELLQRADQEMYANKRAKPHRRAS